jgi:hypothetical protein
MGCHRIIHAWAEMAYTQLKPRLTKDARVEEISRESSHYLLSIPAGKSNKYRLAQLDDYAQLKRADFRLGGMVSISLLARASSNSIPGTWGFGLWNDPFGLSLGFGGNPFRLPALPNAVWFFGASAESYLSFQSGSNTSENSARSTRSAANGFLAQSFRAPKFHPSLILAGLALPFSRKTTRRLLGKIVDEDGIRLSLDVTQWHSYSLDWRDERVSFEVDNVSVFESAVSPEPPLGLVIWIDNQYAAFTPEGKIGFGVLENPEPAWLEIKDLDLKM